jgi:hypothetical protein
VCEIWCHNVKGITYSEGFQEQAEEDVRDKDEIRETEIA